MCTIIRVRISGCILVRVCAQKNKARSMAEDKGRKGGDRNKSGEEFKKVDSITQVTTIYHAEERFRDSTEDRDRAREKIGSEGRRTERFFSQGNSAGQRGIVDMTTICVVECIDEDRFFKGITKVWDNTMDKRIMAEDFRENKKSRIRIEKK